MMKIGGSWFTWRVRRLRRAPKRRRHKVPEETAPGAFVCTKTAWIPTITIFFFHKPLLVALWLAFLFTVFYWQRDATTAGGLLIFRREIPSRMLMLPKIRSVAFNSMNFGGVGDGITLNTAAFESAVLAISKLQKKGGEQLNVPPGYWLTVPFDLTSHMTLFVVEGAVILGIDRDATTAGGLLIFRREFPSQMLMLPKLSPVAFNLTNFGGVGDGITLNTAAFESAVLAISKLRKKGGGQLNVPPGYWLTAPFNLTSHMTLFLAEGVVILGIDEKQSNIIYAFAGRIPICLGPITRDSYLDKCSLQCSMVWFMPGIKGSSFIFTRGCTWPTETCYKGRSALRLSPCLQVSRSLTVAPAPRTRTSFTNDKGCA